MFLLVLGVALAAVASVAFNLGLVFQKQGARRQKGLKRLSVPWVKGYLTSRRWLTGTAITICGYASELTSFAIAPFALVQPVFSAGIATLAIFAVVVAHERFSRWEWTGVVAATTGALMVVVTARPEVDSVSFDKIAWGRLTLVLVASAISALVLFALGVRIRRGAEVVIGLASGLGFTGAEVLTKVVGIEAAHGPNRFSVTLFGSPRMWAVIVGLVLFGLVGTYFLQVGFEHGRALIVGGVMGLSADMLPLFSGVAVFGEQLAPGRALGILRMGGILLALAGASMVAFSRETEHLIEALEDDAVDAPSSGATESSPTTTSRKGDTQP
jgi:drug/metabolite transporter (DMT)-like permease